MTEIRHFGRTPVRPPATVGALQLHRAILARVRDREADRGFVAAARPFPVRIEALAGWLELQRHRFIGEDRDLTVAAPGVCGLDRADRAG